MATVSADRRHGIPMEAADSRTAEQLASATLGPTSDSGQNHVVGIGKEIATLLVPDRPPAVP
ncbi:hypothetical protein ACFWUP_02665 [Nocardia sp. NPDC058658]|uniref:hypothetical protein n=1 Tax=Nocardia sp. NPDC058658 TaxID=3346580 RepID=UPI00365B7BC2